ncbi:MAG: hypothetical protein FLDDKLPJ_03353 [Phycisphaerae bacterium]|nr:hypothetical protein [Phycisphaerae bacterium]
MRYGGWTSVVCGLVITSVALPRLEAAESDFTTGPDGWFGADLEAFVVPIHVLGTYSLGWSTTGGNPGGFVNFTDPGPNQAFFAAPSEFLGDQLAAYGEDLLFDIKVVPDGGPAATAVILVGNGLSLFYDTSCPTTSWSQYEIPLTPSGWRVNTWAGGNEPTPEEMQGVLGSLDALYIRADWINGTETGSLDNVVLIPEPGSLLLVLIGAAASVRRRR